MNNISKLNRLLLKSKLNNLFIKNIIKSNKLLKIKNFNTKAMSLDDGNIVWVDLEMTGLDINKDHIIEMACLITDKNLNIIAEGPDLVIKQSDELLDGMNDWCKKTHGESGLTAAVPGGKPLAQVEAELIALARRHFDLKDRIVLVGNSIGNDRRFIDRYMPEFAKLLHYRLIDVSSFKEIFREKYGLGFEKKNAHRAVDDIHESIRELGHYLSFVTPPVATEQKKP
jgi:oligoribonuclease